MSVMNVTAPSGSKFYVSTTHIEYMEHAHGGGTILHMVSGAALEVQEKPDDLMEPVMDLLTSMWPVDGKADA